MPKHKLSAVHPRSGPAAFTAASVSFLISFVLPTGLLLGQSALAADDLSAGAVALSTAAVSFEDDVIPILTRFGCNSGACHGKVAGQNGFRLSLRGYAPEDDHWWLTGEFRGRRINGGHPEASLLLLKATNRSPHEGGERFAPDSPAFATLVQWIREGCPGPDQAPLPLRLEASPKQLVMPPGDSAALHIEAVYSDGRRRDVTWLTKFYSNDGSTVSVNDGGHVGALRSGEATVRAHFRGQVAIATFTIPYPASVEVAGAREDDGFIDRAIFDKLETLRIPASPDCGDGVFIRRAYLDATGRLPDDEALLGFARDFSEGKRRRSIESLVASEAFTDYWTLQLADLLQNRKERDHDVRGSKGVRAFHGWLREQVAMNRPWDAIAREVLLASGPVSEQPEVGWFVTTLGEKRHPEESELPDAVAQAFLGTRIGCARCHNHPLEKYTQDDFYRFAAFFARTSLERLNPREGDTELLVAGREEARLRRDLEKLHREMEAGDNPPDKREEQARRLAELENRLAEERRHPPVARQPRTGAALTPASLDGRERTFAPGEDPREDFVDWLTDSGKVVFAGAMVNRVWRHFMGVGLVEPVDDLRDSNPPSNQALWDGLTQHFIDSGYDLRSLARLIMQSRAYQLSAATNQHNATDTKFHSHYYARRLPAEVLLDAICDVTGIPEVFEGYPLGLRAVQVPDPSVKSYFLELFGRSERVTACACERSGEVTLPQLLHLYNGSVREKIRHHEGRLARWMSEGQSDEAIVQRLYRWTLSRPPHAEEQARIAAYLEKAPERGSAFEDVFWALLNTKEFSFNH